ncbi:MAG TPA: hypothetical protein VMH82_08810 [Myxococcota bacterium]|nr:hypothetical protein [Myxococcota bacterium]
MGMRTIGPWACVGIALCAWAPGASAAALPFDAQLSLQFASLQTITASASGTVDVASDGSFTLPASLFVVDQTAMAEPSPPTQVYTKASFAFHNGTGMFGGTKMAGGTMPLLGKVKLFSKGSPAFPPATLMLTKAFTVGTETANVTSGASTLTLSMYQYPVTGPTVATVGWRIGKVVQSFSTTSSNFGTRTHTGVNSRTAHGAGSLNLVIPVYLNRYVNTSFALSAPVTGLLSITFTPEPGALWLQGTSIAALALLGVGRLRHSRRDGRSPSR